MPFRCGHNFEYDLVHQLPYELVTEKGQISANWDVYTSPVLPQSYGTVYVERMVRNYENPMIADISSFEFEPGRPPKTENRLGFLYREHPQILKVIPDDVFAKRNYSNRQYELHENVAGRWGGRSLEELIRDESLENEQMLETRKEEARTEQEAHQLDVLYQQIASYNQRYKQEIEQPSSKHI